LTAETATTTSVPRLAPAHAIDCFSAVNVVDFLWKARRDPYDLVVYQLGNAPCHDYMWGYLAAFPGLVVLHDARLHQARARALLQQDLSGTQTGAWLGQHGILARLQQNSPFGFRAVASP